jgi:hypothetical protein
MSECKGKVKKSRRISKKVRLHYQMAVEQFEKSNGEGTALFVLKHTWFLLELFRFWISCCYIHSGYRKLSTCGYYWWRYRRVALAVACLHRGFRLPFTNAITASKLDLRAMDSLCNKLVKQSRWVFLIRKGVISTRHLVHTTDGKVNGEWKWMQSEAQNLQSQYTYRKAILRFAPRTTRWTW